LEIFNNKGTYLLEINLISESFIYYFIIFIIVKVFRGNNYTKLLAKSEEQFEKKLNV